MPSTTPPDKLINRRGAFAAWLATTSLMRMNCDCDVSARICSFLSRSMLPPDHRHVALRVLRVLRDCAHATVRPRRTAR
jgi:hypothetical protein